MHETSQYHVQVRIRKLPLFPLFQGQVEKLRLREKWQERTKDCSMLVLGPATVGKQFSSRLREFIVGPEPAPEVVACDHVAQKRPWKEAVILAPKQGTALGGICWNKDILY